MAADKLRAQGITVIDLGVGEPDFPTPENIRTAAKTAIDEGFTRYTATTGIAGLRKAVCEKLNQDFGSDYALENCCIMPGGKQGIFNAVLALVNSGDEVLMENPCWVSFPEIVRFADAVPVAINTEATDFHLTAELVRNSITPRTRLLIINSPSNPTGRVIAPDEFRKIVEVAAEHNVWVISDECYQQFVYAPRQPFSAAALPAELRGRVMIAGSFSKTYAMTGWRIGFNTGHPEWITEVIKIQSHSATHPSSISQKAAIAALSQSQQSVQQMLAEYERRAQWLIPALNQIPGMTCSQPEGAFYAFPNIKGLMKDGGFASSGEVAHELLHKHGVVITPGSAFGVDGYLRLSYANSLEAIQEAVRRIAQMVKERSR